ncbi:MAG: hypothetical protein IJO62_00570 [Clostridia bacterium]|nr:hypothetical protein [Clostridia bacterium]
MYSDNDIKIAGDRPSASVIQNSFKSDDEKKLSREEITVAKRWGEAVAQKFIKDIVKSEMGERESNLEMLSQRRMLLSFAASVGFETLCENDSVGGLAQKSFLDTVKKNDPKHYVTAQDNGAFSFYYLAFRRGSEVERRIGQTFAMLCSHDGDPIYQELGEALYCWFLSVVKDEAQALGIIN